MNTHPLTPTLRATSFICALLALLIATESSAQTATFGPERTFKTNDQSITSVFSVDLDGDSQMDVLTASLTRITWYKNMDGRGRFSNQRVIASQIANAYSVFAADLDGDGDQDVLSATRNNATIAWYENTNGLGAFGPQQVITTNSDGARSVFAIDLDGDGDADVISASEFDNKIAWYENDGFGIFGGQQVVTTEAHGAKSVLAADLDGDGDPDLLSASSTDNKIAWYQNDGLGNFGPQLVITTDAQGAWSVFVADLDGDSDPDVLSASATDNKIAWYENTDGLGGFGHQRIISSAAHGAWSVFAADLDNDGDQDVISASRFERFFGWYENVNGAGRFSEQLIINQDLWWTRSVIATDIDDDGDADVISASESSTSRLSWYENRGAPYFSTSCEPVDPPITIPVEGGGYSYKLEIVNNTAITQIIDVWSTAVGPFPVVFQAGPVEITFPPGGRLMRTLQQDVPASSPSGDYVHTCNLGTFPTVNVSDGFDWTKSAEFALDETGITNLTTGEDVEAQLAGMVLLETPAVFGLEASYPNPFNPTTTIRFALPEPAQVRLAVFDVLGREVARLAKGTMEPGRHEITFDASDLPSGVYFARFSAGTGYTQTQRLTLLK